MFLQAQLYGLGASGKNIIIMFNGNFNSPISGRKALPHLYIQFLRTIIIGVAAGNFKGANSIEDKSLQI
jgi:hypothetical protein